MRPGGAAVNLVVYAVPFFILAIIVEWLYGLARRRNTYRLNDSVSSLFLGVLSQARRFVTLGVGGYVYYLITEYFSLPLLDARHWSTWLLALGLAQAGEFGFVLLAFCVANAVIPTAVAEQLSLVIALSMLLTPALFIFYDKVSAEHDCQGQQPDADTIDRPSRIIIAGRGRVGGIIDRILTAAGHQPTVIDYSSAQLENLRKFGVHAYFGDATRPDLLHAAGIAEAKLLVVAIDDKEQINQLVAYAIKTYPKLHVLARAVDREHVYHLWAAGCRDIVRETYDSSLRMGRSAFEALGVPSERAQRMVDEFNHMDRQSMVAVADAYDLKIPAVENPVYIARVREISGTWREKLKRRMTKIAAGHDPDYDPEDPSGAEYGSDSKAPESRET